MHEAQPGQTADTGTRADLADLVTPDDIVSKYPNVFGSLDSLRWFERSHRAELIKGGALMHLGGRKMYHLPRFNALAVAIGQRKAAGDSRAG